MSDPDSITPDVVPEVDLDDFEAAWRDGATVLDVRNPHEYLEKHVPGAVLVPLPELGERLDDVPDGRPLYVICAHGARSRKAAEAMRLQLGWQVLNVTAGTEGWAATGRPIARGSEPGEP
jgi:rhodanese-related sulfurtransferase